MHINIKLLDNATAWKANILFLLILLFLAAPSKPRSLGVATTETSAILIWAPPLSDGGRDDVFYVVKYKTTTVQQFGYYSPSPPISGNSVTVTSLVPGTKYTFMVVAENGVTQEFSEQFVESDRTSPAISATTKEGGEHIVQYCFVSAYRERDRERERQRERATVRETERDRERQRQ